MNIKRSRILTALGLALLAGTLSAPQVVTSQEADASSMSENWDIFRSGGDNIEKGDKLFEEGKYEEALEIYKTALETFQKLRASDPNWNRSVVSYRITTSQSKVSSTERKINEAKAAVSGKPSTSNGIRPSNEAINQQAIAEIVSLRGQVDTLKKQLAESQSAAEFAQQSAEQAAALAREKTELQKQVKDLITERDAIKAASDAEKPRR